MLLVIPDIRLLQNLAYGLLFVFVKLDWAVLNQAVIVLGGIFWEIWPRWVPFLAGRRVPVALPSSVREPGCLTPTGAGRPTSRLALRGPLDRSDCRQSGSSVHQGL
jgi:hypothetical protein